MRVLESKNKGFEVEFVRILAQRRQEMEGVEEAVREIIVEVREKGDEALVSFAKKFDGVDLTLNEMEISRDSWEKVSQKGEKKILNALQRAAERIESFHRQELLHSWFDTEKGGLRGQMVRPLKRAGVYVPGGKAAYPSSLLMNAIPAKVAGVSEVVVVTPPQHDGVSPYILAAAQIVGVNRVFLAGGAQAIAALAYGTESIPQADIIVGPGNIYVATAKRLLFGVAKIDMVAGPSEILVLSDGSPPPAFIAADLLSQAEHDEMAWPILITSSDRFAQQVQREVAKMMRTLPRQKIISASIEHHGIIILVGDLKEGIQLANRIAPEHLELAIQDPFQWLGAVENAGAIFLGPYTPEAAGDYLGGPNHVLPTGGTARFFSPLGVEHFIKKINILSFSRETLEGAKEDLARLARMEGLEAHAQAVEVRDKEV
jgi:histidinol dehydrogenase